MKPYRFQAYNSIKHHPHTVSCSHDPKQSLFPSAFPAPLPTSTCPPLPYFPSGCRYIVVCVYVFYIYYIIYITYTIYNIYIYFLNPFTFFDLVSLPPLPDCKYSEHGTIPISLCKAVLSMQPHNSWHFLENETI